MHETKIRKLERKQQSVGDAKLVGLVQDFRRQLFENGISVVGLMPMASLAAILEMNGMSAEVMITDFGEADHYWLKLPDGRALDPMPPLYLGKPLEYHLQSEPSLPTGERFDPVTGELYEPAE